MSTPESRPTGDAAPPTQNETLLREILSALRAGPPAAAGEEDVPSTQAQVILREIVSTLRNSPAAPPAGPSTVPQDPGAAPPPPTKDDIMSIHVVGSIITWLIIGFAALGSEGTQDSFLAALIVIICTFAQPFLILGLFARLDEHGFDSETSNKCLLAGIVGVLVTTACTLAFTDMMNAATIFWCLSGNYIGWGLVCFGPRLPRRTPWVGRRRWAALTSSSSGYQLVGQEVAGTEDTSK